MTPGTNVVELGQGLDFVAVDVETANENRGSVCAIGPAVVRDGRIVAQHDWLARPPG